MDDNNKPHTGDVYNISVNVGYAESVNPSAKVVNIYQSDRAARGARQKGEDELDKIALREEIMAYVGRLDSFATEKWAERIEPLWERYSPCRLSVPRSITPASRNAPSTAT